jgi:hypothetical protein
MSMPELSPLVAANLVCHECGWTIKPKAIMGRRGQKQTVTHLEYRHTNPETGCNYLVESNLMTQMEMKALREDGTTAKI